MSPAVVLGTPEEALYYVSNCADKLTLLMTRIRQEQFLRELKDDGIFP